MATNQISGRICSLYDTTANWTSSTKILLAGEIAVCSDTGKYKVGDGTHKWSELTYPDYMAKPYTTSLTLSSASWIGTSAPYKYTITSVTCTATQLVDVYPQSGLSASVLRNIGKSMISPYSQAANSIVLQALNKPTVDIPIVIEVGLEPST
jgi:hypothetical protein